MRDSPNGKRYGRRDPKGNIVEAYGFDLSPIAARHAEFVRLAEAAREERELMGRLRRRATIARKGIAQILEAAAEYGSQGEEWSQLARDTQGLAMALKRPESPEVMARGVESLGGARTRHVSVWRVCSRRWIQTPWGPKTDPTNIPTKQFLILNRIR